MSNPSIVVRPSPPINVQVAQTSTKIIQVLEQGPAGAPGSSGSNGSSGTQVLSSSYQASVTLSGHKVCILDNAGLLEYADNTNPDHLNRVVGITVNAIAASAADSLVSYGEIVEPSWNWSIGKLWLGAAGSLVQTPPSTGFLLPLGRALSATLILFSPGTEVLLAA